jgi:Cu-processing system permease protein
VSPTLTIARYVVQEAVRRKVFVVVLFLTALFLGLYALVNHYVFIEVDNLKLTPPADVHVDARTFAGAFLLGLAMFATLFLGVVLAVFLTLSAVSGDAERGLLQPLVVRPIRRGAFLGARYLGAAGVCSVYVLVVYLAAMVITGGIGHWWPDRIVVPSLELVAAVLVVTALSLFGTVFLSATANGIAIFMLFGAGLVAGLLGSIGHALNSHAVKHAATIAAWALPFEALYQDSLRQITADASGLTGFLLQLGPFGGAYVHGWPIRVWTVVYLVAVAAAMVLAFRRRDL